MKFRRTIADPESEEGGRANGRASRQWGDGSAAPGGKHRGAAAPRFEAKPATEK